MNINYRNDNTIFFTVARMNPPTPGHLYVISELIKEALNKNIDHVYVILSKTNDNNENPIPCSEKINILGADKTTIDSMTYSLIREMISEVQNDTNISDVEKEEKIQKLNNMNVISICVPDVPRATPFTVIGQLIYSLKNVQDINLFVVIGDDRGDIVDSIADIYFYKKDNVVSIDKKILGRSNMGTYKNLSPEQLATIDIKSMPVGSSFSGSFVRKLVKYDLKDKFNEIYTRYLDQTKIDELYNSIKNGLELPVNKKRETAPKPIKYTYPLIKDVVNDEDEERVSKKQRISGGKKTKKQIKRKTRKYNKNKKTKKYLKRRYRH